MPSGVTLSGASFTKAIASNFYPHFTDLVAGYYYGPDLASSVKNVKAGSAFPTATASGTPTYGTAYADVNNNTGKYFDFGTPNFGPFTYVMVMDAANVAGTRFHGTNTNVGSVILQVGGGGGGKKVDILVNSVVRSSGTVVHPGTTPSEFVFVGMAYDMLNWKVFQKSTSLGYTTQTGTLAFPSASWGNWRTAGVSVVGENHRVAATGLYGRMLNDTEIQKIATVLSFNLTKRGLTCLF